MPEKMKAAVFHESVTWMSDAFDKVYAQGRCERLAEITDLYPVRISRDNFYDHVEDLQDLDVIFSTWDMVVLSSEEVQMLPNLKAVFYAAGASSSFRESFEENGVVVCSATAANAIPVAEFALAQVLLAGAGAYRNSRECVDVQSTTIANSHRGCGNYGNRVSILGNGAISSKLQDFLKHHDLEVVVVPSRAENRTVSIAEAFATSFAVVNLFPDRDDNVGVYNRPLFESMMDSAVFINVGRGRQVNETDLIAVMKERPDLTALLDITWPEPPIDGSELYTVPNIQLTGHLAGSKSSELIRMADFMIEDFQRWEKGEPLKYRVRPDQL
ncbi:NAD(P)-dependent oxidoreductase [Tichowtungia aerotolerans]|uniref:Phosphoglycerate dehydrogenase n=1 Tax=Tichowtungia aerotolerans TaxID=2697043 RepID=A0A6P1M9A3_9BACT|nr:NAD(P)-dependent oxidoreductase [Tichowtungia aerotolerans]QHI70612.1 phosphoglycerate dehydrogenase [Tichowtungia aerotolerans]